MPFFIIKSIRIYSDCDEKIRKNLKPDVYPLAGNLERGFFGQNISVQAIVGMNGSGKSSLLELMFRMVNNFAAQLFRGCGERGDGYRGTGGRVPVSRIRGVSNNQ